jgi:hypothetical protein
VIRKFAMVDVDVLIEVVRDYCNDKVEMPIDAN